MATVAMKITRSPFLILPFDNWCPMTINGPTFIITQSRALLGSQKDFEDELRELCIKYGIFNGDSNFDEYD